AVLELTPQGRVRILTGASDMGQGAYTVLTQIVAQEMGLSYDSIDLIGGDTALTPEAQEAAASRQTWTSGNAVKEAAVYLRNALMSTAARALERKMEDLIFKDDHLTSSSDPQLHLSLRELAAFCQEAGTPLSYKGAFDPQVSHVDRLTGQGSPFQAYVSGSQLAEVEVDLLSGKVRVLRVVNAQDVGKAINPQSVEGQLQGAVVMGLGMALKEDFKPGKTHSFRQYTIPTMLDMPEIIPIIIEEPEPSGPFGAKGAGEAAMIPTAPAITNAIYDACGIRLHHLPATPQRVRQAIKKQKGG
ncbi:MAG: molybdopterin-dependent oxidoreductase, partial [Dehalococcoidia bacterium]|nr:molybdopterin-dependent oxidoreductase [Dehalococcoidia bacterium]